MEHNTVWKSWVRAVLGVGSLHAGLVLNPTLKVRLCVILLLFKDMREKEFPLEVRAAYEILGLFILLFIRKVTL